MLKYSTVKFLEQLGQYVAFDSILQFLLDDTCILLVIWRDFNQELVKVKAK